MSAFSTSSERFGNVTGGNAMTFGEVDKIDHKEYPERLKSLSFQALL